MEVYTGLVSFGWPWFFQIANTLILVALLAKFLFKPVNKMLEKRKNTIANDLSTAENQRVEAEALRADYEKKIKEIRIEADAILKEARNKADERAKEIKRNPRHWGWCRRRWR